MIEINELFVRKHRGYRIPFFYTPFKFFVRMTIATFDRTWNIVFEKTTLHVSCLRSFGCAFFLVVWPIFHLNCSMLDCSPESPIVVV
jgi:hypothetical protein